MKTKLPLFVSLAAVALFAGKAHGQTFYADDFNRTDSNTLGSTSTGSFAWTENTPDTIASLSPAVMQITNNQFQILSESGNHDTANAFVNYDLNAVETYSVNFQLQINDASSTNGGLFILPRAQGTDVVGNSGWVIRENGTNNGLTIQYYSGFARQDDPAFFFVSTTNNVGTAAINTLLDIQVDVSGNLATLSIGGSAVDSNRSIGSNYNNATADSMMFAYSALAQSSRNLDARIDNLVVAVPEPGTFALLLGSFAALAICIRRRRA